jgi:hypothetical protein
MNSATLALNLQTERNAVQPMVEINGMPCPDLTCLGVELTTGLQLGTAKIRLAYAGGEDASPITLNRFPDDALTPKIGARVRVYYDRTEGGQSTIFLGAILGRQDSGAQDIAIWE